MPGDLNKVMIIGNLTRDPELRYTPNGQAVVSFGVATNRRWNDQTTGERREMTEFHNVVAWGKLAEICNQFLKKGKKVYVEGRLQTRSWEGQDGVRRTRTEIIASDMRMLGRKEEVEEEVEEGGTEEVPEEVLEESSSEEKKEELEQKPEKPEVKEAPGTKEKTQESSEGEEIDPEDIPF
jgi:single-strand DNA-binding protein